jgi:hypothetical protein
MRKVFSILVASLLVALAVAQNASCQQPPILCGQASFQPEVLSFYGDSTTVLNKIEELKTVSLSRLRVYMFLVETADAAELSLLERVNGSDEYTVSHWRGASAGDLREQITSRMLSNRGVLCIGEQSKALLAKRVAATKVGVVPAPASVRAAFGHTIQKYGNNYMRLTVFLFC